MTQLKEIFEEAQSKNVAVAKAVLSAGDNKVLALGFGEGSVLKDHKTAIPAVLYCLKGRVVYNEGEKSTELNALDQVAIPIDTIHNVVAKEPSLCMVIKTAVQ